jgi:N,N'-diacetyllegionaminate synthase
MSEIRLIAEIAQGFEGKVELAKVLGKAAARAGAQLVKYQLVFADDLATSDYQYYELFKGLEMDIDSWRQVKEVVEENGAGICLDLFGARSVELAKALDVKSVKLHPTDIDNEQLIALINGMQIEELLIGVGGASEEEIRNCLNLLNTSAKVALIHGFQAYPTENAHNQVSRLLKYKSSFPELELGFADHVVGDHHYAGVLHAMSLALGARYFEKHLSLGEVTHLEDFESAIQPDQFAALASQLQMAEEAFGSWKDEPFFGMSVPENTYRQNIRRSWVANSDLEAGTEMSRDKLELKRSSQSSASLEEILTKRLVRSVKKDQVIQSTDVES